MDTGQWLLKGESFLISSGVPEARANVEFIMADVLKVGRGDLLLHASRVPTLKQSKRFWDLVLRRGERTPLAYVLGTQPFMGLEIKVSEDVLIPRPETEEVVGEALALLKPREREPLNVLEIGTGSGCIAIALAAALPAATIYATDISPLALNLAADNALAHHRARQIRFIQEDLFKEDAAFGSWADLVISNPPYIPTGDIERLEPEVLKEPILALDGGEDGLAALRAIIAAAPRYLKPAGWLALEIGSGQAEAVLPLFESAGFSQRLVRKDLQGLDRIAIGRLPSN